MRGFCAVVKKMARSWPGYVVVRFSRQSSSLFEISRGSLGFVFAKKENNGAKKKKEKKKKKKTPAEDRLEVKNIGMIKHLSITVSVMTGTETPDCAVSPRLRPDAARYGTNSVRAGERQTAGTVLRSARLFFLPRKKSFLANLT